MRDYSAMNLSTLKTLAELHSIRLPHWYHADRLAKVRDELKKRRLQAKRTLDEIDKTEKDITSHILNNRRKRIK